MFWPCETRTSTCRNLATISSGLYRFLAITVLLDVKDIPQVGPLQWGRSNASQPIPFSSPSRASELTETNPSCDNLRGRVQRQASILCMRQNTNQTQRWLAAVRPRHNPAENALIANPARG